eukprot:6943159-Alexandrium_andersonii.AAC.1
MRVESASAGTEPPSSSCDDRGRAAEAMSDIGKPVFPVNTNEDVDEDTTYLVNLMEEPADCQEGLSGRRAPAAPDPEEA